MANLASFILAGAVGYLLGSIPFGFLYVWVRKGVDLREFGSGRTGGTNSLRAAGLSVGIYTSLSDVLKGASSVWLASWLFSGWASAATLPWVVTFAGVCAVIGHNWSIFLSWKRNEAGRLRFIGWRGGAGTGPNVGWTGAIWWGMFPIGLVVMAGLLLLVGMASVASMAMAAVVPLAFALLYFTGVHETPAYMVGGLVTAAIVIWALRPNIKRLLAGNERVVGPRARRLERRKQQVKNAQRS